MCRFFLSKLLRLTLLLLATGLLAPSPATAQAQTVEGQRLAARVQVAGVDLRLNGAGVRQVAWFKGYIAALYLRERADNADQVVATSGPKRVQLRMLVDVPAKELAKAVHKGVLRNSTEASKPQMEAQLPTLEAQILAVGTVRKGDVVDIDFDGDNSIALSVNGSLRGAPLPSALMFAALLRAFVGDKPYDDRMKAGLLGQGS